MNTIIEKIRAEVERLMRENSSSSGLEGGVLDLTYEDGINTALNDVLEILDTLQEQPVCEGLEEEISRYLREDCSDDDEPSISEVARHFAQWGAEHASEQMMKEAVEGRIESNGYQHYVSPKEPDFTNKVNGINCGGKVRIIIVKEDTK